MKTKIKQLSIQGLRGIQNPLTFNLSGQSILIYGENGTGKSSISDSLEWFLKDEVKHLSGEEIDLKEAMRNSNLNQEDESSVAIEFTKTALNSTKSLKVKKDKLVTTCTNDSADFKKYLLQTQRENIILRHQLLTDFIDKTKGNKLRSLSDVIGFSEVNKAKDILKKSYNSIKAEIKNQNFEAQINTQKQIQIEKIGAAIGVDINLFEKINEIIAHLKLDIKIKSFENIDEVLQILKVPINSKIITELNFLEDCKTILTTLENEIIFFDEEYRKYYDEFIKIKADVKSIMQVYLSELLKAGDEVLKNKYHTDESCPLCLQPKSKEALLQEIELRLKHIEESATAKSSFDLARQTIEKITSDRIKRIERIESNILCQSPENDKIRTAVTAIKNKISAYQNNGRIKVTSDENIKSVDSLLFKPEDFSVLLDLRDRITTIKTNLENDNTTILYSDISSARDAFLLIKKFEHERKVLEKQRASMEIIYNEFVKKQKEELENFVTTLSSTINEFYQFMNPDEQFQELKIITIGEEDELNGITIEYKYEGELVSPPQKYFSESHLNCFGIAFFLTSVIAFNEENGLIVLDDVISSFDSTHRKRFADLLFEKFSDYQIILLTHESEWFQYVNQIAKRKQWNIKEIKWSDIDGAYIDSTPLELKEIIEKNLISGNVEILGNPIRKYLEHFLKEVCNNLEVRVIFKFNNDNEKRMPDELLNELKSKIDKHSNGLKAQLPTLERVSNSTILANLLSHDNKFSPKLGDLKAFWKDVQELEALFMCDEKKCNKYITTKHYDTVLKEIRCACGKKKYDWKN